MFDKYLCGGRATRVVACGKEDKCNAKVGEGAGSVRTAGSSTDAGTRDTCGLGGAVRSRMEGNSDPRDGVTNCYERSQTLGGVASVRVRMAVGDEQKAICRSRHGVVNDRGVL